MHNNQGSHEEKCLKFLEGDWNWNILYI